MKSVKMDYSKHKSCSCAKATSCAQSLDEMEFERGIWSAAQNGEMDRLIKLAKRGVDAVDASGYTALHYAARSGHTEICRELLLLGAAINVRTRAGRATPLHRASTAGHLEIVKLFLQAGADVTLKDADGLTPIHRAAMAGHKEVLDLLLKFDRSGAFQTSNRDRQPVQVKESSLSAENADLIGLLQ